MQRLALVWSFALALAACSGNSPSPGPDANEPAARTFGAQCTTVSNTSTECDSGVCTGSFDQIGHPVCSKQCTMFRAADPSCPEGSMGRFCNMMGFCRP
jgi:hypothetical protein